MTSRCNFTRKSCILTLLFSLLGVAFAATPLLAAERYTAQRKPRVTVLDFDDTNTGATGQRYSSSVEAMLVTFLKHKSQFIVVERQKLGEVLAEWTRNQRGQTNIKPTDPSSQELLEKIDSMLIGSVTLLDAPSKIKPVSKSSTAQGSGEQYEGGGMMDQGYAGQRVEIDVKALGRADGRIIAAAKSSGPVSCMRAIVERLGVALEQQFLRPYYGKLRFNLTEPENVRIHLTPILLDGALDEEKPPVERSETVLQEPEHDVVEPWTTNPTTYTITNVLTGWYTVRLERPGYEDSGIVTGNEDWVAKDFGGRIRILYRKGEDGKDELLPMENAPRDLRRFVVRVDPRQTDVVDGDKLGFSFADKKKGGSIEPLVRRQYIDKGFGHTPQRVILIGRDEIEVNHLERPQEYGGDENCDLFEERLPNKVNYGPTYVAAGETFDFDSYRGGDLIIEDYKGEKVPVGRYEIAFWEPNYQLHQGLAVISDNNKPAHASLVRETLPMSLATTGKRLPYRVTLRGDATKYQVGLPLNFDRLAEPIMVPVDSYTASTSIPGLGRWRRGIDLLPKKHLAPPVYDQEKDEKLREQALAEKKPRQKSDKVEMPIRFPSQNDDPLPAGAAKLPVMQVKTRLCVGGHLAALSSLPSFTSEEVYVDQDLGRILDAMLSGPLELKVKESRRNLRKVLKESQAPPARARLLENLVSAGFDVAATRTSGSDAMLLRMGEKGVNGLLRPESGPNTPGDSGMQKQTPTSAEPLPPAPATLPSDPAVLGELLSKRLGDTDLLILDDKDMDRLKEKPHVAAIIARFVAAGGAVFAYISDDGEYGDLLGTPLRIEVKGKRSGRFELEPGDVAKLRLETGEKKVKVGAKRRLPQLGHSSAASDWRVVALTKNRKDPRILESGHRDNGGYVVIWLDKPELFRTRLLGNRIPEIEVARATVEKHVLDWARFLMYRRYDDGGGERSKAEESLFRYSF